MAELDSQSRDMTVSEGRDRWEHDMQQWPDTNWLHCSLWSLS